MFASTAVAITALAIIRTAALPQGEPVPISDLETRSGCDQGTCPDGASIDLLYSERGNGAANWSIRWNDCNSCGWTYSSVDGCADFNSCGRSQNVCIDWRSGRGHRIWKDNGDKECYGVEVYDQCYGYILTYHFTDRRACW